MTPEEIKTKSAELAALYVAKANGKSESSRSLGGAGFRRAA